MTCNFEVHLISLCPPFPHTPYLSPALPPFPQPLYHPLPSLPLLIPPTSLSSAPLSPPALPPSPQPPELMWECNDYMYMHTVYVGYWLMYSIIHCML